ncbi:phosphatase [Peribacillus simplex]|uniref:Ppx/GppA phosphatase family protein n=1 Tax=Peribacillus simplex TaxID=1478 RepID=UPI00366A860C
MIYGIIDVGSNTIRLNIYSYQEYQIKSLLHKKVMAGLAGYVVDGYLSPKGIKLACATISDFQNILNNFDIKHIYMFATASLRNIVNTDEAIQNIREYTGLHVDVISGEEEATLGFTGASYELDMKTGLFIDIGGGSTELVEFSNGQITRAVSMPIGSLSMYSQHVNKLFPKEEERVIIQQEVLKELNKLGQGQNKAYSLICGVGGNIRATKKLNNHLLSEGEIVNDFQVKNIQEILSLLNKVNKKSLRRLLQVVPDRIHTIIPGMIILDTIAQYYSSDTVCVSSYGVREGYLYSKVLKEGSRDEN